MSTPDHKNTQFDLPELWATLQDLEDGSLGEERRNALVQQLNESPAARRAYHEYFHQVAVLRMEAAQVEAGDAFSNLHPILTYDPWWRKPWLAVAATLLLAGFIGALVLWPAKPSAPIQAKSPRTLKALAAAGTVWDINGVRQPGSSEHVAVKEGDAVHVLSGIVKMDLASGSSIAMPGGSRASFPTLYRPVLQTGWLWVDTGASKDDFEISTPQWIIQDIGTRFGVRIDEGGHSEVHLLEGGVNVISQESGIKLATWAPDGNGRAIHADGSHSALPIAEDPFPMLQSRLIGKSGYENAILSHMPICYWKFNEGVDGRFDNAVRGGRTAKSGPSVTIHAVGAEDGLMGFGPSNQALYLPADEAGNWLSSVVAFLDGEKGVSRQQGAVTFWINQKSRAKEDQILWLSGKPHPNKPGPTESLAYTYLTASGHLGFTMTNGNQTASAQSKETLEPGRWHQVGISWSKSNMDLYLNGRRVGHSSDLTSNGEWSSYGNFIRFGKPTDDLQRRKMRSFHGWFDEYALWDRPLTLEEVSQQFQAAQGNRAD